MAFETTICEECPTPIQWSQLRTQYLRCINIALDERDKKLREQDRTIELIAEFASALRAFFLAEDESVKMKEYRKMAARVKRAATAVSRDMDAASAMVRADRRAKGGA